MRPHQITHHLIFVWFVAVVWVIGSGCGAMPEDPAAPAMAHQALFASKDKLAMAPGALASAKMTPTPGRLPIPRPGPEDDWTNTINSWNASSADVRVDADTSCFATLRATNSASQVSCMAWNKSTQPGTFQLIRWHSPPSRDVPPETVHDFTLDPGELRRVTVANVYPERGEDEFSCVLILDDLHDCDDDRVSLALAAHDEDDPHVPAPTWFRRHYCDALAGMGRRHCETDRPRSLELLSDEPSRSAVAHVWNRSYRRPVRARLQYRNPCDPPSAWRGAAGGNLESREITMLHAAQPEPVHWRLIVLPRTAQELIAPFSDIVIAGALGYDPETAVVCEPETPECDQGATCDVTPAGCHGRSDFEVEGETYCAADGTGNCYATHGIDYCSIPGGRCGGGEGHSCDAAHLCAPGHHCVGAGGDARCEKVCEVDLAFCWTRDEVGNPLLGCGP